MGKLYESRPSYRFLGILMCIQLAISAGSWAYAQANQAKDEGLGQTADTEASSSQQKAIVMKVAY